MKLEGMDWCCGGVNHVLLLFVGLLTVYFFKRKYWDPLHFWGSQNIVSKPGGLPVVGNIWKLWTWDIGEKDLADIQKYGKIFGYLEGSRPVLMVADQIAIKEILIKRFNDFLDHRDFMIPEPKYRRKLLFLLHGEEWRAVRNICSPFFSPAKIKQMSDVMSLCVGSMIERIKDDKSKTPTDVPTDVRRLFRTLTVDVISRCVYGITFRDLYDENSEIIRHADAVFATSDMSSPLLFLLLLFPRIPGALINITNTFFGMKSFQFFVSMTEFILKSRRRDDPKTESSDFLHLLLEAQEKETATVQNEMGNPKYTVMTKEMLIAQTIQCFTAAFETSTALQSVATHCLAVHTECQTKLRLEIQEKIKKFGTISYEMLGECTYLEAYLKECLRMYPPVPRLERVATSDSVIAGIPITKGQLIQIPVYAIHYSSEQYSDPRKFNPERWRVNTKQDSSSAWLPFGAGPRNCIGMRFAMEQTKLAIGNLVYQFTLHPSPNMKEEPDLVRNGFLCPPRKAEVIIKPILNVHNLLSNS